MNTMISLLIPMMTRNFGKLRTGPCESLKRRRGFSLINNALLVITLLSLLLVVFLPRLLEVNNSFFVASENTANLQHSLFTANQLDIGGNNAPSSAQQINQVVLHQSVNDKYDDFDLMMFESDSNFRGNYII